MNIARVLADALDPPEQGRVAATLLVRTVSGWTEEIAADELHLPELAVVLPFPSIYRGVRFA